MTEAVCLDKNSKAMIPDPEKRSNTMVSPRLIWFWRELNNDSLTLSVEGLTWFANPGSICRPFNSPPVTRILLHLLGKRQNGPLEMGFG